MVFTVKKSQIDLFSITKRYRPVRRPSAGGGCIFWKIYHMSYINTLWLEFASTWFHFSLFDRIFTKKIGKVWIFLKEQIFKIKILTEILMENRISASTYKKISKFATNLTFLTFIQESIETEFVKNICFFPALCWKMNWIDISENMRGQAQKIGVFLPITALKGALL